MFDHFVGLAIKGLRLLELLGLIIIKLLDKIFCIENIFSFQEFASLLPQP